MFECKRCGKCCNPPVLYPEDIKRIREAGYEDFVFVDHRGKTYMKDIDEWCMFLEKGKKAACKIYPQRPNTCRLYPSELNNGDCRPVETAFDRYLEKRHEQK